MLRFDMASFRIDSSLVRVSITIGKRAVVNWKDIEEEKGRERQRERERLGNITRGERAFAIGLPILIRNMFAAVVKEIDENYNDARNDPGDRSRVQFQASDDGLYATRAEPHEATLILGFLGGDRPSTATLEVDINGSSSSGAPDGTQKRYRVYCNPDGAFFFDDLRSGANYLKESQVRAEFMKQFAYYLV